ncbi:hypothetical protein GIB67_029281 [Kingdonia uniflora]|uniref:Transposase MuDR plant domain-containing protein n=1 Tax=Kingdonia uniflora TaxID=39325 RepID=A0A7J7N8T3_9MAGN|nr:hypothetical protein GIB67_029281 [Kingdonia uniflora]
MEGPSSFYDLLMGNDEQNQLEIDDDYQVSSPSEYTSGSGESENEESMSIEGLVDIENPIPNRAPFPIQLGHEFKDAYEFRNVLIDAVIKARFEIKFLKSAKSCVRAKCKGDNCEWLIYAAGIQDTDKVRVRTLRDEHTCPRLDSRGNKMAVSEWVSNKKNFGSKIVKFHFLPIVKAFTSEEYNVLLAKLKIVNNSAADWIKANNPETWATSQFIGETYGHITSNMAEIFNNWILAAMFLPIFPMLESIQFSLMKLFCKRRAEVYDISKNFTPYAEAKLAEAANQSKDYRVYPSSDILYEIRDTNNWGFTVGLSLNSYTCLGWQRLCLPYSHAYVAIHTASRMSINEFCHPYYSTECYRLAYHDQIDPVLPKSLEGFFLSENILQVTGGTIEDKVNFAYGFFEKQVPIDVVFEKDEMIYIIGVTKDKGYEGVLTRWSV